MATAQEIANFLEPAIAKAKIIMFDEQKEDSLVDALVSQLARMALSQIEAWIQRPLVLSEEVLVDKYPIPKKTGGVVPLRAVPVVEVQKVEYQISDPAGSFEELIQGSDWKLVGSDLFVPGLSSIAVPMDDEDLFLRVTYRGGYATAEDNPIILTALIQQINGLYNTRQYLGYSYAGGSKAVKVDIDTESGLFRQVMFALEGEVYMGDGGPWI